MKKLRKQISSLQKQINIQIDCVNQGGCIHFAYYLSKRLNALGVRHKIVFGNHVPIDISYEHFQPVAHVMVYITGIGYVDGLNIVTDARKHYNYLRHYQISEKKLDTFRNGYQWNESYNIRQNSRIENLINRYIEDDKKDAGSRIHYIHETWRDRVGR